MYGPPSGQPMAPKPFAEDAFHDMEGLSPPSPSPYSQSGQRPAATSGPIPAAITKAEDAFHDMEGPAPQSPSPYSQIRQRLTASSGPVPAASAQAEMRPPRHTAPAAIDATSLVPAGPAPRRQPGLPVIDELPLAQLGGSAQAPEPEPAPAPAPAPASAQALLQAETEKQLAGSFPGNVEGGAVSSEALLTERMTPGATAAPTAKADGIGGTGLNEEVAMKLYQRFGLNGCISFEKFVELHQTHLPREDPTIRPATGGA